MKRILIFVGITIWSCSQKICPSPDDFPIPDSQLFVKGTYCLLKENTTSDGPEVQGYIFSRRSGNPINSASIYIPSLKLGTFSKDDGSFTIHVQQGVFNMEIKSVGYSTMILRKIKLKGSESKKFAIYLGEDSVE